MRKYFWLCSLTIFILGGISLVPVYALEGTTTVSTKELLTLAQRKNLGLGVKVSMISPASDILATKIPAYDIGLAFDFKFNENLDTGPRFGIASCVNDQGTTLNASYQIIRFGYGAKLYAINWSDHSSLHGFANLYFAGEVNYFAANKIKDSTALAISPASFAGLGVQAGVGLEFTFGPNTGAFAQIDYLRTSINDISSHTLPLDGLVLTVGSRMAFF
ncbi:MAG: outer membrane beta-barrel protein [bacterium]